MNDILVVGSGISGLTSALLCAKSGLQVKILEQAPYIGGLLMSYKRCGHLFPTGVHYIGLAARGQLLGKLWKYMGVRENLPLESLDPAATDILHFPGYRVAMASDKGELLRTLCYFFPREADIARAYLARMSSICNNLALYNLRPMTSESFSPEDCVSLECWLKMQGASEKFISALGYLSFLHGLSPAECPLYVQMIIHDSFLHGTHRLAGGSQVLVEAFIKKLREFGVSWNTNSRVTKIVRGIGGFTVTTSDNSEYEAKKVIYTGDIGLLPGLFMGLRPSFVHRLQDLKYTTGIMGMSVLLPDNSDMSKHNHYLYTCDDTSAHLEQNLPSGQIKGLFVSADQPGSAHILASMSHASIKELMGKTKSDYMTIKTYIVRRVHELAQQLLPELAGSEIVDSFTPLTFRRYCGITDGSAYGIAKSIEQVRSSRFSPMSKIPGLYFAGQSIILPGVVGASISALAVASVILGPGLVEQIRDVD